LSAIQTKKFRDGRTDFIFANFVVPGAGDLAAVRAALEQCEGDFGLRNVVRQTFFLAEGESRDVVEAAVSEAYGENIPGTNYVYQPPADGEPLAAEMWAFTDGTVTGNEGHASVASWAGAKWSFVGGLLAGGGERPEEGARRVLEEAEDVFARLGSDFRNIVRTWYYMGNILAPDRGEPRYNFFNQARNEFYLDKWPDLCATPASTGIGMNTDRFAFEAVAVDGDADAFEVVWVDNPLQTPPHRYSIDAQQVRKPSFSRAACVALKDCIVVFVSGTASIRESKVIRLGDARAQTVVTIENIEALVGRENLVDRYGLARGAELSDVQQLRVYVKRPQDVETVRECCRASFPDVPASYMIGDVCRPECLMEIEAVLAVGL